MTKPVLAVEVTDPDGEKRRIYTHPVTGETAPSITTVLNMISKPKLVDAAAKVAAEYAASNWNYLDGLRVGQKVDQIRWAHRRAWGEKAGTGDIVHDLIDCWSSGRPFPVGTVDSFATQFIRFCTEHRPRFIENEFTVWSRTYQYAGTGDFIAEIGGRVFLCDTKTGRRLYPEVGLQLAALAGAEFILRQDGQEDMLPRIDGIAALHIRPRSWKLTRVYEQGECFSAFLAARRLLHWERQTAPNVFLEEAA